MNDRLIRFAPSVLVLLVVLVVSACNNNNPQGRLPVQGEVFLDGSPLLFGSIEFESTSGASPAVITGGAIADGRFTLPAPSGLIP
ncbi:MAG: hypothetical protein ACRCUY_03950 [Thermoguttaceae bacterium]